MTRELLDYFRAHATPRGLVLASETKLVHELKCSPEALARTLTDLTSEGKIEVLAPFPYAVLALKPRSWSGSRSGRVPNAQQSNSNPAPVHREVPVSSRAAAATQQEDGGAGEGEALLEEVLRVLGPEAIRDEFRFILAGKSPALIRRCLRRVQATKHIRASKPALFRSLLERLSN